MTIIDTKLPRPKIARPPTPLLERWGRAVQQTENYLVLIFSFGVTVVLGAVLSAMG